MDPNRFEKVKQVRKFERLGSTQSEDGRSDCEINVGIVIAKTAFNKFKSLITKKIPGEIPEEVWATMFCVCEAWNISNTIERKFEVAKMRYLSRMLSLSWTRHASNESVLQWAGVR